jgi:hypothetical protein
LKGIEVPPIDPFTGDFEIPSPRPMVSKVEKVRTEFESKLGIPYENGGPITFCINEAMFVVDDGIRPLLEVKGVYLGGYLLPPT